MIKITGKNRTMRECTAPYEQTINGKAVVEQIRVLFYPPTLAEIKGTDPKSIARKSGKAKDGDLSPDGSPWLSTELADRIYALPDLADEKGKPFEVTPENLDKLTLDNLRAIGKAILENSVPKSTPSN